MRTETTQSGLSAGGRVKGASDVVVVGAGPAGCAAGIVLARAGIDVCVIDAAVFPRDKICGDALAPAFPPGEHNPDQLPNGAILI